MVMMTEHGRKRGLLRCNMDTAAFEAFATEAFWRGLSQMECQANLGRFVDNIVNKKLLREGVKIYVRVWQSFVLIFSVQAELITVYQLTPALVKEANRQFYLKVMKTYERNRNLQKTA